MKSSEVDSGFRLDSYSGGLEFKSNGIVYFRFQGASTSQVIGARNE